MTTRFQSVLSAGVFLLGACASRTSTLVAPLATTSAISKSVLERVPLADGDQEHRLMLIEYPAGAKAPAHRHPVAGLCYVLEGTAVSEYEGEKALRLQAGDSYQDFAERTHRVWENPSATAPLRFVCSAVIGKNEAFAIPID